MSIRIVNYDPSLKKYFESLNREWLEKYFSVEAIDVEYFNDPHKLIIEPGGQIFFAELDGEIIGTCSLIKTKDGLEMAKMAVTESVQGKGIGRLLVLESIKRAKQMSAKSLMLVTNSSLLPAVGLYTKLGFKEIFRGTHPKYKRGDLVMQIDFTRD